MHIRHLSVKNFRCFNEFNLVFEKPLVLITGSNGSGKTSLLEALHYACYLRSFRTYMPKDILQFEHDTFFIKIGFGDNNLSLTLDHELQVGFSGKKKLVKLDQKAVNSYKELNEYYRIVTITEDDLELIKGNPENRRAFLDQALMLMDQDFLTLMRNYKQILSNRNALLYTKNAHKDSYVIWTKQLWECAFTLQEKRYALLNLLERSVNVLLTEHFDQELSISLVYRPRLKLFAAYEQFCSEHNNLYFQENALGRTLFGVHLDDITIQFAGKKSKLFASRGQQKLTIVLLKIALLSEVQKKQGPAVLLLDDFMTDFDIKVAKIVMKILKNLPGQLIFTSPVEDGPMEMLLKQEGAQLISLGQDR